MKPIEIIVIIVSAVVVIGVIIKTIVDKKKGKCTCGCDGCPHAEYCKKKR